MAVDMSKYTSIILIAVDDSEPAEFAFMWYRDYIHKPEYYVVLLFCTDQNDQEIRDASPGRTKKIVTDLAEKMKRIEDKFGHLMELTGIKGRIRKGTGKPGEAIVKAAHDEGAAMIITGSRGLGKIKRTFLHSVSDYVVHNSKIPVITCRKH
ncbi:usp-like protein isoform 2 [Plakobranchus ocellatus]|uniref:Usp-like protein isoform 2 n=1 Tax=Plakobranchus ocellatus TaxID=259542 RepID=A0AAV3Y4Q1_9GAST|nr:usp-like protein isoform 2 [Plakobranchus ocellatus]